MNLKMYALKDRKTDTYGNPMFLVAHGQATRMLADEVNRDAQDNTINRHADDFALYYLGEWDNETCNFQLVQPEFIVEAATLKGA